MGMRVALFSDFSLPSLSCAAYTAILAMQSQGLKVTILTLDPEKNNCAGQEFWSSFQLKFQEDMELMGNIREVFERLVDCEFEMLAGSDISTLAKSIVCLARSKNVHLIVMPSRCQGDLKVLPLGNLTHSVVSLSEYPVVVVRKLSKRILKELDPDKISR